MPPMQLLAPRPILGFIAALGLAGSAFAIADRPDQVLALQRGAPTPFSGELLSADLGEVVLDIKGKERKFSGDQVLRVTLGTVPEAWTEASKLSGAGDHSNAAALYGQVAGDAELRDVVRAYARLEEAKELLLAGAADPSAFGLATDSAERLLADFPDHREVPAARLLAGRAQLLFGEPARAAELLTAIIDETTAGDWPVGYPRVAVFEGGLLGARALLDSGDASTAGELFAKLEREIGQQVASLPEGSENEAAALELLAEQASLGEGWKLLGQEKHTPARSFFQSQLDSADAGNAALRGAARLGLAEALEASGELRQAQIQFAQVIASASAQPEVVARAMIGRARTTLGLDDPGASELARNLAEAVVAHFGTTSALDGARRILSN